MKVADLHKIWVGCCLSNKQNVQQSCSNDKMNEKNVLLLSKAKEKSDTFYLPTHHMQPNGHP